MVSDGESIHIQGITKSPFGKPEEKNKTGGMTMGTNQNPINIKPDAGKPITNAAKAVQEKLANKIKEQKKKVEAALGTASIDIRPSKIITFDYLTLKRNPKIIKILEAKKEENSGIIFSDYVYMIREDNLSHKSKRILYITEFTIYVLHHRTYQVERTVPITDLNILIVVKTSGTLCAYHFEKA